MCQRSNGYGSAISTYPLAWEEAHSWLPKTEHRGETKVATMGFPRLRPGLEAWQTASPGVWDVNTR